MINFFILNLIHYLRLHIKGCLISQLDRNERPTTRQLQTRINLNYRPLSRLCMDLKVMPRSSQGHKFILCIIDEVTNYLITMPIYHWKAEEIGEALIETIVTKYCVPDCIIRDQDSAFILSLMNYLFNKFNIKFALYNHQSLQAEHRIKSLSMIFVAVYEYANWHIYPWHSFCHTDSTPMQMTFTYANEVEAVLVSSSRFHTIKTLCISHITITSTHASTENTTQHYRLRQEHQYWDIWL